MATIADLTGETIDSSYGTLLMVTDTAGITSSLQTVQDGLGANDSALKLSTTVVRVNGSLGVGVDSPEYVIHAQTADDYVGKFESTDAGASIILEDNGSTTDGNRITVTSDALSIATANVTALTVDGSQRVGIGTTAPAYKTQIVDSSDCILSVVSGGSSEASIYLGDSVATRGRLKYDNSDDSLAIYTNNTERMRIDSSGVVKLNQVGESEIAFRRNNTGTAVDCGKITFGDNTDARAQIQGETTTTADDGELTFSTADNGTLAERMRIDSNGNIGTANAFHVTNGGSATAGNAFYSPASNELGISSNGAEAIRVDSSQRVGIGTDSPNANAVLDVASTTMAFMPPRMTTTQRDAISSPTAGMVIYNSTTNVLDFHNGTTWGAV